MENIIDNKYDYIKKFEKLGFGMFVHFGLFSLIEEGEWIEYIKNIDRNEYAKYITKFNPVKNWAKNIVKTAKLAGCKYISITTRHHEGFSLFDTKGLSDFDAPHSKAKRDVLREFVEACRDGGIMPIFYHTLVDWHNPDYNDNFDKYLDYLYDSVEILCTEYGEIGGLWFDGTWDKKNSDWKLDRLYNMIRSHQPNAMIINNTGLSALGVVCHPEIDSVTFERGKPRFADISDRYRAGEMCQVLNEHWGYAKYDINYKSINELVENLVDCRKCNCNFLLNVGPMGNGVLTNIDKGIFEQIGKWIKINKNFIYDARSADVKSEGADILYDGKYYYAIIKGVTMHADPNVQLSDDEVKYFTIDGNVKDICWLDNGEKITLTDKGYYVDPFRYHASLSLRVAKFELA